MARQEKKSYELSDAEQRDLITLIQQGKALPEKYRFILFEDKREVELVWNGKTRDVCTTVLPFQTLEHIDEPRTETKSAGRPVRQPRPSAARLDQQADLGRQQADSLVAQGRRAAPADRGRRRPQADLHRPAVRRRRGFQHGHRDRRRDLPQRAEPAGTDRLPRHLGARRGHLHRDDLRAPDPHARPDARGWEHLCAYGAEHRVCRRSRPTGNFWHSASEREHCVEACDSTWGQPTLGIVHDVIMWWTKGEEFVWNPRYEPYDEGYLSLNIQTRPRLVARTA